MKIKLSRIRKELNKYNRFIQNTYEHAKYKRCIQLYKAYSMQNV
jgi:hypothetical protein